MIGGRVSGRVVRASLGSLLGSILWAVTLLSVLQWSAVAVPSASLAETHDIGVATTLAAPHGEAGGAVAYAQLPATPAVAEKRVSLSVGPSRGDPVDALPGAQIPTVPKRVDTAHTTTAAVVSSPSRHATVLPPSRAPPIPA